MPNITHGNKNDTSKSKRINNNATKKYRTSKLVCVVSNGEKPHSYADNFSISAILKTNIYDKKKIMQAKPKLNKK